MEKVREAPVKRSEVTRTASERPKTWMPPERLPDYSDKIPGYHTRWVRRELRGQNQDSNILARIRQGYEIVTPAEIGVFDVPTLSDGRFAGAAVSGDLILMKVDQEIANQRKKYYEEQARSMQRTVDQTLDANQNDTMPISRNVRTVVEMGRPNAKVESE